MPRGGSRKGAGRPSTWYSGCSNKDTIAVRIPRYLKEEVLNFAHQLDEDCTVENRTVVITSDRWNGKYRGLSAEIIGEKKLGFDVEIETGETFFLLRGELEKARI